MRWKVKMSGRTVRDALDSVAVLVHEHAALVALDQLVVLPLHLEVAHQAAVRSAGGEVDGLDPRREPLGEGGAGLRGAKLRGVWRRHLRAQAALPAAVALQAARVRHALDLEPHAPLREAEGAGPVRLLLVLGDVAPVREHRGDPRSERRRSLGGCARGRAVLLRRMGVPGEKREE